MKSRFIMIWGKIQGFAAFSEPGVLRTFEEELFNLRSPSCLSFFETLTDAKLGGQSTAALSFQTDDVEGGFLAFEGHFSTEIPSDVDPKVRRLGQASFASQVRARLCARQSRK